MPVDEELMQQMDEAAALAKAEIDQNLTIWSAKDIVAWWSKWYLKTGHKRLGRILVSIGKAQVK